jgi:hypothetical protein
MSTVALAPSQMKNRAQQEAGHELEAIELTTADV